MMVAAIQDEDAYISYMEVRLRWHYNMAKSFLADIGRLDDFIEMLESPVMQERARREIR